MIPNFNVGIKSQRHDVVPPRKHLVDLPQVVRDLTAVPLDLFHHLCQHFIIVSCDHTLLRRGKKRETGRNSKETGGEEWWFINQQQLDLHNITVIMLDSPSFTVSKSIFYRGISLKEYLQKQASNRQAPSLTQDQTIFDQFHQISTPISPSPHIKGSSLRQGRLRLPQAKSMNFDALADPKSGRYLPSLHLGKIEKFNSQNQTIERNSTDTSLGNEGDLNGVLLPDIKKRGIIRERNITMASRSSSRSVSCRKRVVGVVIEVEELSEEATLSEKPERRGNSLEKLGKERQDRQQVKLRAYSQIKNSKLKYFNQSQAYC